MQAKLASVRRISNLPNHKSSGHKMGLEQSNETWIRVDLFCDGIGEDVTTCVAYGDPEDSDADMPMVTDCCATAEDARRLTLYAATRSGWIFDMHLRRWLCPHCVNALNARRGMAERA
jgi:hypothetical protein